MAYMKDLYMDLQAIGIEPNDVDIEAVGDFMEMFEEKTGKEIGLVAAIREMYVVIQ